MRGRNTVLLILLFLASFTIVYILRSGPNVLQRLNQPEADHRDFSVHAHEVHITKPPSKLDQYRQGYPDPHNDTVVLPSKEAMQKMDQGALGDLYHRYINSLQIFCRKVIRLGKLDDGGWDFCDDYRFRPRNNCLVYSYGIQFDFSFDDAIVKKYNCEVHSFDPSMKVGDHKHGQNVFFHATGLSGDNNPSRGTNWKMRTLQKQREELGHSKRPIDVLKIDIEEYEYMAVPNMLQTGILKDIRQMAIEFHVTLKADRSRRYKEEPPRDKYFFALSLFKDLYDIGFRIFWTHRNPTCKFFSKKGNVERVTCHEVSFVNINNM
ncbi:probable methyltransferase-like protein 24 isoform X1 [Crassostrea angulata]|uniref:probable methyltransferase-like protein 24 isoform X1 n=1 Tax=Magallana gigas TaxID=29159 RepID=UPI00148A5E7C|nr:methyltransferase-like protein 24 isoform X1 [Crassostrea gigas]XP_052685436.1 probable methyltransferase-like protein 24 isoform X1 [Crassostrea angulata]